MLIQNQGLLHRSYERYESSNIMSVCILGSCIYIIYSILLVIPIFADLIFGFTNVYYYNNYNCINPQNSKSPFIDITSWILVNGLFGYFGIIMYIKLKFINTEEGFCKKLTRMSCYAINLFSLIWIIIGMISFFINYYNTDKCISSYPLLYNYLLIRMILGPLIWASHFIMLIKE